MNPVDSLLVIAEISLGLVGFTAVVAVLRRPDGGIEPTELFRSLHLLGYGSLTLLLALFPYLLTAMGCEAEATWRISSSIMFLTGVVGLTSTRWLDRVAGGPAWQERRKEFSASSLAAKSRVVALLGSSALNTVLQAANAVGLLGEPKFWPFLLGLLWLLVYCLAQFASLLFMRPSESLPPESHDNEGLYK